MALTSVPTNARVIRYQNQFYREYIRANRFSKMIGTDENSPIQLNEDLKKQRGEQTTFYLVNRLQASISSTATPARTGYQTLKGYEEPANIRSFRVTIGLTRHAVTHWQSDEQFSAIDLVESKDVILKDWFKEYFRERCITALGSISTDGSTHQVYADANATDRNTWLVNNTDRVLFGASGAQTVHATGITALDTTADIINTTNLNLWKDLAKTASPKIRPVKLKDEEEWYVVLLGTKLFRQAQTALAATNREAWVRAQGDSNPLFTGGDLIYDGMIIKEIPEIAQLSGTPGAGGTTSVAPGYLIGAQAIAYAVALRSKMISQEDDYEEVQGAGIKMLDVVNKMYFGAGATDTTTPRQNGVATGYFAVV